MSMTLADIYEYLSTGELSQVVMGSSSLDDPSAGVPKERYKQLRNSIQLGLTDLHKRFLIKERYLKVDVSNGPGVYHLTSAYAQSNPKALGDQYLLDLDDSFKDDMLKIARVEDQDGEELLLNTLDSDVSLITPNDTSIKVPTGLSDTRELNVVYHANHPVLNALLADSAPATVKVDLPHKYLHALTLFVASRVMNPVGLRQEFHEGNNYFAKYLKAVQDLEQQGMNQTRTSDNDRLEAGGWV